MGVIINNNKLVIITEPKTIHLDLDNNLKDEIDFIIKPNEFLAAQIMKNETG